MLKQFDVAVADFTQALRISPKLVIAYEHRGAVYEQLEQFDHAVDDYAHAIAIAPHNPVFYVRRGTAYNNLRQYDNAIRDFTEAIRLQPSTPNAYRLRAIAEQATGNTAAAQADRAHLGDAPRDATRRKKNQ
jgi:tetratricopeptide (TPR) repeat protein